MGAAGRALCLEKASFDSWLTSRAILKQMLGIISFGRIERGLQESGNSWCFCGIAQGPVNTASDQFFSMTVGADMAEHGNRANAAGIISEPFGID